MFDCGSPLQRFGHFYVWLNSLSSFLLQKVVPHITDAIQEWIERVAMVPVDGQEGPADVCVIELGGTIGTIMSFTCFDMNYFPVSEGLKIDFLV